MSIWVATYTGDISDTHLPLPFAGLPELRGVGSEHAMRELLTRLNPAMPPETIMRQAEIHWKRYSQLAKEDLILAVMPGRIALAQVDTPYMHRVEDGEDVHEMEVSWLKNNISKPNLHGLQPLIRSNSPLQLIEHAEQRKQIYALLDKPHNRFVKWQWLLGIIIGMKMIAFLIMSLKK